MFRLYPPLLNGNDSFLKGTITNHQDSCFQEQIKLSLVMRKPVFGVCDQLRLKPSCSADETSWRLEISDIETRDIILSRHGTTKVLIRLCGCAGWSAPLLFAYGINRFSQDMAQIILRIGITSYTYLFQSCLLQPIGFKIQNAPLTMIIIYIFQREAQVGGSDVQLLWPQLQRSCGEGGALEDAATGKHGWDIHAVYAARYCHVWWAGSQGWGTVAGWVHPGIWWVRLL